MKYKYWIGIWWLLICVCISAGFITRASITNISSELSELDSMPYIYQTGSIIETLQTDEKKLIDESPGIIVCEFNGNREYKNLCFLSEVKVVDVIKGENNLKGNVIHVYEPVALEKNKADNWIATDPDSYKELTQNFDINPGMDFSVLQPGYMTENGYNYTLLSPGQKYLLFLTPKVYPTERDLVKGKQEFVLMDNVYSKLSLRTRVNGENYTVPNKWITMKDSLNYDILLASKDDMELYFKVKDNILSQLQIEE